jgi:hypothetical protein
MCKHYDTRNYCVLCVNTICVLCVSTIRELQCVNTMTLGTTVCCVCAVCKHNMCAVCKHSCREVEGSALRNPRLAVALHTDEALQETPPKSPRHAR